MRVDVKGAIVSNDEEWIYDYFGISCVTPKIITDAVAKASETGETIDVYINSNGGEIFSASEMYATLREYGNVRIHVTGIAASAASVLMCAGESDISPTSMVMIHNVHSTASGDYRDMKHSSEVLKSASKAMAQAYCEKSGMSMERLLDLMDRETWLTAEEAVKYGLVDRIAEYEKKNTAEPSALAAAYGGMIPHEVIQTYQHKRMKAQYELEILKLKGESK